MFFLCQVKITIFYSIVQPLRSCVSDFLELGFLPLRSCVLPLSPLPFPLFFSSTFELHLCPFFHETVLSEHVKVISFPNGRTINSSCHKVRSSGTSARNLPALVLDDLTVWHEELCEYGDTLLF